MRDPDETIVADEIGPKLRWEVLAEGPITCLRLYGTIDEQFDSQALLAEIAGGTVILELGGIEKISSFGIREWVDFVARIAERAPALYFVECAPKVIDQLNMVANFAGPATVVSFHAPYRCDYCDDDRRHLFQIDPGAVETREAIRRGRLPERACAACGHPEHFDEDPSTFFSYLRQQPDFALPDDVQAFLAARLQFVASVPRRKLRIDKLIDQRTTWVRLAGDLDASFPSEKLAEGLEGEAIFDLAGLGTIDEAGMAAWRRLLQSVTPHVDRLRLRGCPSAFVERLGSAEDLGPKCEVLSFALPYACAACKRTAARTVDVGESWHLLKFATPPERTCADCGAPVECVASDVLLGQMAGLPKPATDEGLRARSAAFEALLAARAAELAAPLSPILPPILAAIPAPTHLPDRALSASAASPRRAWVGMAMGGVVVIVVLTVAGLVARTLYRGARPAPGSEPGIEASAPTPPAWIRTSATREGDLHLFVGRAEVAIDPAAAIEQADDAALDEAAAQLALEITDPGFIEHVASQFQKARTQALSDLARARTEAQIGGDGADLEKGSRLVARARRRVADALRRSGAGILPIERADLYWEKSRGPKGVRVTAWSRFAISDDAWRQLCVRLLVTEEALGTRVLTWFPSLGWRFDAVEGVVAIAVAPGSPLRLAGVQEGDLLLTVLDRVIHDAPSFCKQIEEEALKIAATGGVLTLQVRRGAEGAPFETRLRFDPPAPPPIVPSVRRPNPHRPPRPAGVKPARRPAAHGNVWDDDPNR
ncbi:MAG: hypothetical protein EXR72_13110 [Myxococcales bacterium]|nr:hypothetical protein [Myxococcales bacterium]